MKLIRMTAIVMVWMLGLVLVAGAPAQDQLELAAKLEPFINCLNGQDLQYRLHATVEMQVKTKQRQFEIIIQRDDAESLTVEVDYPHVAFGLVRTNQTTALILRQHGAIIVGRGTVAGSDVLQPLGILQRLVSPYCAAAPYLAMLANSDAAMAALTLTNLAGLHKNSDQRWITDATSKSTIGFSDDEPSMFITGDGWSIKLQRENLVAGKSWDALSRQMRVDEIDRTELERSIARGIRRITEIVLPATALTKPDMQSRQVAHGKLEWIEDQRVVTLWGDPQQIGQAHGQLLKEQARRCVDSTIYVMGLVYTAQKGKWFIDQLRDVYQRLSPHIPPDHKAELNALADAAGIDREEIQLCNVFPEMFHCSGFALFGSATVDGKLYHGRVLDYMTLIGLQDVSTVLIVKPQGKIPFANVGYAGFIGSVSGMNREQISLGEMGGGGEGNWDGAPMATLMRRALEECSSLEQVKELWTTSPRTCEYYYVFADGKIPDAVGVAATAASIEFVAPGQGHEKLGSGIEDAVVMSGGDRMRLLRQRVIDNHGTIDAPAAMTLMNRPVAMASNLHNVLFVPQDMVMYVAQANHEDIAANRPYVRIDVAQLLEAIEPKLVPATAATVEGVTP